MLNPKLISLAPIQVKGPAAEIAQQRRAEKVNECINKMGPRYLLHPANKVMRMDIQESLKSIERNTAISL
jgi:hypothetical protein